MPRAELPEEDRELLRLKYLEGLRYDNALIDDHGGVVGIVDFGDMAVGRQVNELAILPDKFKTGFPVTNRAQLGFALDATTSPAELGLIHIRAGQLATTGNPRDWVDGEVTPIANAARAFGQEPSNGVEWYFPKRLSFDLQGMAGLKPNAASKYLGLHPKYATKAKLPVIAVQSDLSKGKLKTGVQNFVALNHSPLKFINAETTMSHLDPLLAAPRTNVFLKAFVPWLKKNAR